MQAHLLSIGTELVIGQTVDTNAPWLAQRLAEMGIECTRQVTVGDDRQAIATAVSAAADEADVLIATGGLGPTLDDLTRFAVADVLGAELAIDEASLAALAAFFAARRRAMPEANRVQALIPRGATPLANACGTAPGIHAPHRRAAMFFLPGVPSEMRAMFENEVRPRLAGRTGGRTIVQHTLHTFGLPESVLGEQIADLMRPDRNPHVGTSAADLVISIRINAAGADAAEARRLAAEDADEIRRRLGSAVFGEQGETLAEAVGRLLLASGRTVSTAESCTGGLVAKRLTDVSGSSGYFGQGFVTYANEAKTRLLAVPAELIARHGAVSREVAEAMAVTCRRFSGTDYAISTTGIAGPTGGTAEKPVGLVYLGLATETGCAVRELRLGETLAREAIRDRTAKLALNLLRLALLGQ